MHCFTYFSTKLLFVITLLALQLGISSTTSLETAETPETKESGNFDIESRKKEESMQNKMLPFMIIPFMISTAIIPMMLVTLKFMLMKSAFIGKLAVIMLILNMLRSRSSNDGGVLNHNIYMKDMSMAHYGYGGDEEYGAYINGKKRSFS